MVQVFRKVFNFYTHFLQCALCMFYQFIVYRCSWLTNLPDFPRLHDVFMCQLLTRIIWKFSLGDTSQIFRVKRASSMQQQNKQSHE